jgi:hypothetical protein
MILVINSDGKQAWLSERDGSNLHSCLIFSMQEHIPDYVIRKLGYSRYKLVELTLKRSDTGRILIRAEKDLPDIIELEEIVGELHV